MLNQKVEISFNKVVSLRNLLVDFDICVWCLPALNRVHTCNKQSQSVNRAANDHIDYLLAILIRLHGLLIHEHLLQWLKEVHCEGLSAVTHRDYVSVLVAIQVGESHQISPGLF